MRNRCLAPVSQSQCYEMFIVQPRHRAAVEADVREPLTTPWGERFRLM